MASKYITTLVVLIFLLAVGIFAYLIVSSNSPSATTNSENNNTNQSTAKQFDVTIINKEFSPANLTVHVGDTVVWTNRDAMQHTVTSNSGSELISRPLNTGFVFSHTFTKPGTYAYHCSIHIEMLGTVTVLP